ncbi:MAG: DUF1800 domain-containing protein [Bacteroidota bacterium]
MNDKASIRQILHLYSRAGFGATLKELAALENKSLAQVVQGIFADSEGQWELDVIAEQDIPNKKDLNKLSEKEKKQLKELSKDYMQQLNVGWMKRMQAGEGALREKMTFFWHGHFACRSENPVMAQQLNNIQRKHALGSFRDLLIGVSQSPAMLSFLNNQQNRKAHPNENFARELMELFTLGRGNYTEQDVKESARAFTGWAFNRETYEFEFKAQHHDGGSKTFLGKTGNFNGEDVLDIILGKKECARFICDKLYRFFVNETTDKEKVEELAEHFYASNYDIGLLMKKILDPGWFCDEKNIGVRIKSPVELIAGMNRMFSVAYEDEGRIIWLQKALGQVLFFPPNVAGWSGGRNWIDSSTLMLRLKIPSVVLNSGIIEAEAKEDIPEEYKLMVMKQQEQVKKEIGKRIKTTVDWDAWLATLPADTDLGKLIGYLLLPGLSPVRQQQLSAFSGENIKAITLQLVSMPEYQIC